MELRNSTVRFCNSRVASSLHFLTTRLSEHEFRSSEHDSAGKETTNDSNCICSVSPRLIDFRIHIQNGSHTRYRKNRVLQQRSKKNSMLPYLSTTAEVHHTERPSNPPQVLDAFHKIIAFTQPNEPEVLRYVATLPVDDTTGTVLYMIEEYVPP